MNAQLESIADARRAEELRRISVERQRVARRLADEVIGNAGTARPEAQTAELRKVAAELEAKAARLAALESEQLVSEFASDCL